MTGGRRTEQGEASANAKIVLGMGASHGPLLATPPEQWDQRVEADRRNPALAYRDGTFKFEELAKLRAKENLQQQIELPITQKRYDACQRAMAEIARVFAAARPDVAVLIGNDQMEVFEDANSPAFMVCFGESVDNIPFSEEQKKRLPPGIEIAEPNHHGKTAASNMWLVSLYVTSREISIPLTEPTWMRRLVSPALILREFEKVQNNPPQRRFLAQIGDDNQPPGFEVASSPFKATQLFRYGPTAYLRREVAWRRTDGSKRDEEAAH